MEFTGLCKELNNWFEVDRKFGKYEIKEGGLTVDFLQTGQFFRIVGSVFNDGVYQYPVSDLHDETFEGAIWPMAVPSAISDLLKNVNSWIDSNKDVLNSPYQSESFGGYSYSKATGNASNGDGNVTWQSHFANELNQWRKIRP